MIRLIAAVLLATCAFLPPSGALALNDTPAPSDSYRVRAEEGEHGEGGELGGPTGDVVPVALWTTVGIVGGGIVLAALYLLKRRVGGFPNNPEWTAPISIEPSSTFATEATFGGASDSHHGSHH